MDGVTAEDDQPDKGQQRRYQQHTEDEFAQGAALGDARDEQPDEGSPGEPPAPVEDGPGLLPFAGTGLLGVPQAHGNDLGGVVRQRLAEGLDQPQSRPAEQEDADHDCGYPDVEHRDDADALLHAADHRDDRQRRDHRDQHQLGRQAIVDAEQLFQSHAHLADAESQRGGHTKHAAQHAEDVEQMPGGPEDAIADKGVKRRS